MNLIRSLFRLNFKVLYGFLGLVLILAFMTLFLAIHADNNATKNAKVVTQVKQNTVRVITESEATKAELEQTKQLACVDAQVGRALLVLRDRNPAAFKGITLPSQAKIVSLASKIPDCLVIAESNLNLSRTPAGVLVSPKTTGPATSIVKTPKSSPTKKPATKPTGTNSKTPDSMTTTTTTTTVSGPMDNLPPANNTANVVPPVTTTPVTPTPPVTPNPVTTSPISCESGTQLINNVCMIIPTNIPAVPNVGVGVNVSLPVVGNVGVHL